jgi:Gpi18-like mannosyltransferase
MKDWFRANRKIILLVTTWLLVVNVFALLSLNRLNLKADNAYAWVDNGRYTQNQGWNLLKLHSRWDSNWYLDIARNGYHADEDMTRANVVFFPLYPLLIKALSFFLAGNLILSGWILSMLFLVLACVYLYKLVCDFHKNVEPLIAVSLLLIFPTAFFLNAVYTEALFLFLSVATFYYAKKRNYLLSGVLGFFASLTRITGVLLFLGIMAQFICNEGFGKDKKYFLKILPLMLVILGSASFFFYHWNNFGDFLLFFKVESAWGRSFSFNADHFTFANGAATTNSFLDFSYFFFIIGIVVFLIRKKMYPYVFYAGSTVFAAVSSGTLMSIGRYILVLFPIYIVGASLRNEMAKYVWALVSILLFALNTILFVNWYWAG